MRGKRISTPDVVPFNGITPADAGKTRFFSNFTSPVKDHPRGCGENSHNHGEQHKGMGSPPRMRGKPSDCWKTLPELRITPADAGKTFRQIYSYRIGQDHPRGCGENCAGCAVQRLPVGSPPRMRGKLRSASAKDTKLRITPADAGKTRHHG